MVFRNSVAVFVLSVVLSACGGGSSGSLLPQAVTTPGSGAGPQSVMVSIRIPDSTSGSAALRRPAFVSAGTQSAVVSVNGGTPIVIDLAANSGNCTPPSGGGRTCTGTITAPVGADTFAESLYATTNGTGTPLAVSTTSATIVAGTANLVKMVLDGIVSTMGVALTPASPPVGQKTVVAVTVTFFDASGASIVGSDPFAHPVTLTDSDKTGQTVLSATSLSSPSSAANLTLTYNGGALSSAMITASAPGATSASATLTPQGTGPVVFNDYTTYGYDNQRDIFNPNSVAITPSSVANIHLAWQKSMGDYNVQSQPILATEIPGHAGVLFLAGSGGGNMEAFDALSGAQLWSRTTSVEQYLCDNEGPYNLGAGGTVAYDPGSRSLYVVDDSNTTPNGFAANSLLHLDGATGSTLGSVNFGAGQWGSGELNISHTSVTLANGIAYVGTGTTCDIPSWRGRVAAINVASMSLLSTFFPVWNGTTQPWGGGGIWGWGGVSIDFNGNVVTGVGNADNSSSGFSPPFQAAPTEYAGYGESFVQLSPDLSTVLAHNRPVQTGQFGPDSVDLDLQGTPAIFKPFGTGCDPMAAVQGKSGALFLYDMNQISGGVRATYQLSPSTYSDGYLGDAAYSQASGLVYAQVASSVSPTLLPPGMIAINPGCGSPSVAWNTTFGVDSSADGIPRSVPAVSAGGVVFAATSCDKQGGPCSADGPYGAVWMIDGSVGNLGKVLNGGQPVLYTNANVRAPATIDGNWVYIVDTSGNLYGLTIDPNYAKIAVKLRSAAPRMIRRRPKFMSSLNETPR